MLTGMRDKFICWLAARGMSKPTIARLFHVSRQRVYQIINDRKHAEKQG
jgi:transposase